MKGYRTIIAQFLGLAATLGTVWGVDVSAETQAEITTGIVAVWGVANLILRTVTNTKVGKDV